MVTEQAFRSPREQNTNETQSGTCIIEALTQLMIRHKNIKMKLGVCRLGHSFILLLIYIYIYPVAPVAYQVIHEPDIGQFREFEPGRVHTRINSLGLILVHKLTCGKRESVS